MSVVYPLWYISEERERKKLTKDDIPFGLKLFFCLLRCSFLTYRSGMRRSSRLEYGVKKSISHCHHIYESDH